jgi:hypothetical protein
MTTIHYDSAVSEAERRERLYAGDLFAYGPTPSSLELAELGREMVASAFAPFDPEHAQFHLPVERYAQILGELKPKFIHHPRCKQLLPAMLRELGCDLERTYFDVPRMRTATSGEYLSTGIAYAFHPHRDTWYSAPFCQLNWWLPMFPLRHDNCMAFHPQHWSNPLRNTSSEYNYQEWNRSSRFAAAAQIGEDTRKQPRATEQVRADPQIRLLPPVGGIIMFSAAQLHSTVPNTSGVTRYSIDFRTVNLDDVRGQSGAPNIDSYCTGSTMGDYLRGSDLERLPADATAPYEAGPPQAVVSRV